MAMARRGWERPVAVGLKVQRHLCINEQLESGIHGTTWAQCTRASPKPRSYSHPASGLCGSSTGPLTAQQPNVPNCTQGARVLSLRRAKNRGGRVPTNHCHHLHRRAGGQYDKVDAVEAVQQLLNLRLLAFTHQGEWQQRRRRCARALGWWLRWRLWGRQPPTTRDS